MTVFYNQGKAAKPNNPLYQTGKQLTQVHSRLDVDVSALTNGDIFVLAEGLTVNSRIHRLLSPEAVPALTAANDNDLGFYRKTHDGALIEVDKDIIWNGVDLSSGAAAGDLLRLNTALDRDASIGELLGLNADEEIVGGLVLAITMNVKATTTDRVIDLDVVIEKPTSL